VGRGAFSVVYRGRLVATGEDVAVKVLQQEEWANSPDLVLDFRAEVAVMKAVHHPNVLHLIGACTQPSLRLVSEFCHRGNLFDTLHRDRHQHPTFSKVLSWSLRLSLALGEARGMAFLHTAFPMPLIHRDLKSLNLLISKQWTLKISDFGLSRFRGRTRSEQCGTPQWMSPEMIRGSADYDEKIDVFSFGVNLWELATRRIPWEGVVDVKRRVGEGDRLSFARVDRECPEDLVKLAQRCFQEDPKLRPTFPDIVVELKRILKRLDRASTVESAA
jgi:serine/threonine protein kinase